MALFRGVSMIKRIILGLVASAFATVAHAAGTIPGFSLTPQFDTFGKVMPGCKLYIIQAGTTATPQNAYQDTGLTTALPNPLTCDAAGRLPQWFVADGLIKVRLTDKNLSQVFVGDNLLVVGSSGGGGGGGVIDPTTIATTGDVKDVYGSGTIAGWVRMNGRTIGSATSGATERANADVQALFVWLWNLGNAVPGGRGASAAADWAANKLITLPDQRGRVRAGTDDLGGTDAARLSGSTALSSCRFSIGCAGGEAGHPLAANEIPDLSSTTVNTFTLTSTSTANNVVTANIFGQALTPGSNSFTLLQNGTASSGPLTSNATVPRINSLTNGTGGALGGAHNVVQPTILITSYIKL